MEGEWMGKGVILGVRDRKMTHETKEDEDEGGELCFLYLYGGGCGGFFQNCSTQRKSETY
jgi:hypothetical protein